MPTMYEIYDNHSYEYDELVACEDYNKNLSRTLLSQFDFNNKTVIELGVGTGRLTNLYAGKSSQISVFDRSEHMLEKARKNLDAYSEKITYAICDNNAINSIPLKADFVMEGWSYGHTVSDISGMESQKIDQLISSSLALLNPGGTAIFLETLGTDTDKPVAPSDSLRLFYKTMEEKSGFTRIEIPTDYQFGSVEEASRIMGFFFGPDTGNAIKKRDLTVIKEYTGLWYKNI